MVTKGVTDCLRLGAIPKLRGCGRTTVPGAPEADQKAAAGALGKSSSDFVFPTMEMPPTKRTKGGEVRIVDSSTFKASTNVAMAMVTVHPGRAAGTALAPQRRRMAVLHLGQGKNDCGFDR